jgi:hypothetical protein
MATAFADLTNAIKALFLGGTPLAGGRVYRGRLRPIAQEFASAVVIRISSSPAERTGLGGGPFDWMSEIAIDCYARCSPDQDPEDSAADALLAEAFLRLAANPTLSGGVMDVLADPSIAWTFDEQDQTIVCATLNLRVNHRTLSSALTAWT